ncbi:MAG: hypothetical protein EOO41_03025, partial [Methanobacteriota archaeon]
MQEFEKECDPPAYVRGLIEDELARNQLMLEEAYARDCLMDETVAAASDLITDATASQVSTIAGAGAAASPKASASGANLLPTLPPPASHVETARHSHALVTDAALARLLQNDALRQVVDNTYLVSERDIGPTFTVLASDAVREEQLRQNRPSEAALAGQMVSSQLLEHGVAGMGGAYAADDVYSDPMYAAAPTARPADTGEQGGAAATGGEGALALAEPRVHLDSLKSAVTSMGMGSEISRDDVRLWKVRALLYKDWGRGRQSFLRFKETRERLLAKIIDWQQKKATETAGSAASTVQGNHSAAAAGAAAAAGGGEEIHELLRPEVLQRFLMTSEGEAAADEAAAAADEALATERTDSEEGGAPSAQSAGSGTRAALRSMKRARRNAPLTEEVGTAGVDAAGPVGKRPRRAVNTVATSVREEEGTEEEEEEEEE